MAAKDKEQGAEKAEEKHAYQGAQSQPCNHRAADGSECGHPDTHEVHAK